MFQPFSLLLRERTLVAAGQVAPKIREPKIREGTRKVNNCRCDKYYLVGAQEEFDASFIISWWRGYLKMSTTPEKIVDFSYIAIMQRSLRIDYFCAFIWTIYVPTKYSYTYKIFKPTKYPHILEHSHTFKFSFSLKKKRI